MSKIKTNTEKRTFLKTLSLSIAFLSFGGVGSMISTFLSPKPNKVQSGFGSNGYGL